MTDISISYQENVKQGENSIVFDLKGDKENGLNKTIVNSLRRVLLSSIPCIGFRTDMKKTDIKILKNTSPLHNGYLQHRVAMLPLYIDPETYSRDLLFEIKKSADPDTPFTKITTEDFKIYPLLEGFVNEGYEIDRNKFSETEISETKKREIFRPFKGKYYCDITELKPSNADSSLSERSNSEIAQELHLYGIPRVSVAYEDARWQSVSMATYSFKRDNELFNKVLNEKIELENISEEEKYAYGRSLEISESERYFHRDESLEPYWYEFKIDSVHYMSSKALFIKANEMMIEQLELIKNQLVNVSKKDDSIISIEREQENIFTLLIHGCDDTIGSILQYDISKNLGPGEVCGYKRVHPLDKIIMFSLSVKDDKTNEQNIMKIIEVFTESSNNLIEIYTKIIEEAKKNL